MVNGRPEWGGRFFGGEALEITLRVLVGGDSDPSAPGRREKRFGIP